MKTLHKTKLAVLTIASIISATFYVCLPLHTAKADALSGSQFSAGRIVDDFIFNNKNAMSVAQIQAFLNSKVPNCDYNGVQNSTHFNSSAGRFYTRAEWGSLNGQPAPFVCLKDYYENVTTKANNLHFAAIPGGGISAAQIIWNVSQQYNVNPQTLLILLQKEQSLITDDWPWTTQYRSATGYGCPDSAACDSQYYGFYNQVSSAAWQFQRYAQNPLGYNFKAGRANYVSYNPTVACSGSNVSLNNQATASLYNYTPYQPNQAALNNLYGNGDGCSAYGNRNFWRMFNDWFGTTYSNDTTTPHPNGTLVSDGRIIYLLQNNIRYAIANGSVFGSYNYQWRDVKAASNGDMALPQGPNITSLAPGTVFYTDNSPVYIMDSFGGVFKKQHLSYSSFVALGYTWNDVVYVPPAEVPPDTQPGVYTSERHPTGTVVLPYGVGKIYIMEENDKRHIISPAAFDSNHYSYAKLRGATLSDIQTPEAPPQDLRQGTIMYLPSTGSIFVIDYDENGIMKRPLGPWECFSNRWHYSWTDWISVPATGLPARDGPTATC